MTPMMHTPLLVFVLSFALQHGGPNAESRDVVLDADNGFYVTGFFTGLARFGETDESRVTSRGDRDVFLARYDVDGQCLWVKGIGGHGADEAQALVRTADGHLVVSGLFVGEVDFDPSDDGTQTLKTEGSAAEQFLARYKPEGELDWVISLGRRTSRIGINAADRGDSALACDKEGNVYVVGAVPAKDKDADPNDRQGSLRAKGYGVVCKVDASGKTLWQANLAELDDMIYPLGVAAVGNGCAIGGFVDFPAPDGSPQRTHRGLYLGAFDGEGKPLWSHRWSGDLIRDGFMGGAQKTFRSTGQVWDVVSDGKGGIFATGWVRGAIDFNPQKKSKGDTLRAEGASRLGFVLKVNATGVFQGVFPVTAKGPGKLDDGTTGTDCRSILLGQDGAIRVVGHRSSHHKINGRNWSLSNAFVNKYKKNGKLAWSQLWDKKNPTAWNQGLSAALGSDSRVLVAGFGAARKAKRVVATQGSRGFVLGFAKNGKPLKRR